MCTIARYFRHMIYTSNILSIVCWQCSDQFVIGNYKLAMYFNNVVVHNIISISTFIEIGVCFFSCINTSLILIP